MDSTPKKLLRLPEVMARTSMSKALIYKLISVGKFPKSIKIWGRMVGWVEREVDDWIAERVASR